VYSPAGSLRVKNLFDVFRWSGLSAATARLAGPSAFDARYSNVGNQQARGPAAGGSGVLVRLTRPGGVRSVLAESVLLKHQLLIRGQIVPKVLDRGRDSPATDGSGLSTASHLIVPRRLVRTAITVKPSTLLRRFISTANRSIKHHAQCSGRQQTSRTSCVPN
jgi:hypothetical protein